MIEGRILQHLKVTKTVKTHIEERDSSRRQESRRRMLVSLKWQMGRGAASGRRSSKPTKEILRAKRIGRINDPILSRVEMAHAQGGTGQEVTTAVRCESPTVVFHHRWVHARLRVRKNSVSKTFGSQFKASRAKTKGDPNTI